MIVDRATLERVERLKARPGWFHVGCSTCGDIHQWPESRRDEPTYCPHTGRLVFGIEPSESWTRAVPVDVLLRGLLAEGEESRA